MCGERWTSLPRPYLLQSTFLTDTCHLADGRFYEQSFNSSERLPFGLPRSAKSRETIDFLQTSSKSVIIRSARKNSWFVSPSPSLFVLDVILFYNRQLTLTCSRLSIFEFQRLSRFVLLTIYQNYSPQRKVARLQNVPVISPK